MYWFCLQDVFVKAAIADVRRFVWLVAVKFTLVGSHLKVNHITIFELKVLVFWSSYNLHLLYTTA